MLQYPLDYAAFRSLQIEHIDTEDHLKLANQIIILPNPPDIDHGEMAATA